MRNLKYLIPVVFLVMATGCASQSGTEAGPGASAGDEARTSGIDDDGAMGGSAMPGSGDLLDERSVWFIERAIDLVRRRASVDRLEPSECLETLFGKPRGIATVKIKGRNQSDSEVACGRVVERGRERELGLVDRGTRRNVE